MRWALPEIFRPPMARSQVLLFFRRNAHTVQRGDHRAKTPIIVQTVGLRDVGIVDVAAVVIDGAATGDAAHNRNAETAERLHMHFPTDVLVAAHHDGGIVHPEQKNVVRGECLKHIFLKGLIVKRVMRAIQHGQHRQNNSNPTKNIFIIEDGGGDVKVCVTRKRHGKTGAQSGDCRRYRAGEAPAVCLLSCCGIPSGGTAA